MKNNEFDFLFIYSFNWNSVPKNVYDYLLELLRAPHDLHSIAKKLQNNGLQILNLIIIFNSRLNLPFQAWKLIMIGFAENIANFDWRVTVVVGYSRLVNTLVFTLTMNNIERRLSF